MHVFEGKLKAFDGNIYFVGLTSVLIMYVCRYRFLLPWLTSIAPSPCPPPHPPCTKILLQCYRGILPPHTYIHTYIHTNIVLYPGSLLRKVMENTLHPLRCFLLATRYVRRTLTSSILNMYVCVYVCMFVAISLSFPEWCFGKVDEVCLQYHSNGIGRKYRYTYIHTYIHT